MYNNRKKNLTLTKTTRIDLICILCLCVIILRGSNFTLTLVILSTSGNFVVLVNLFNLLKNEKHLYVTQSVQWQSINGMMAKQTVIQSFIRICNCFI